MSGIVATSRSEWCQMRTSARALWALLATAALSALLAANAALNARAGSGAALGDLGEAAVQQDIVVLGAFATIPAVLLGVISTTVDRQRGVELTTALLQPRPHVRFAAKLLVATALGAALGAMSVAVASGVLLTVLQASPARLVLGASTLAGALVRVAIAGALWATLGVAVGQLIGRVVPALALTLGWILIGEAALTAVLGSGRSWWLPGQDPTFALVGDPRVQLLDGATTAALVLVAWVAVLVALASARLARRPAVGA